MEFEILKGTKDYEPKDKIILNSVLNTITTSFESYGFRPFDTPEIEYLETLTNKYSEEDEIVQEIFKVKDRGNRELGLRYDLTIPLCRYIAQNIKSMKLPFRRYALGKVFRDGPIKKGRLREFIQCDGDVIGVKGEEIEAELLDMFYSTYNQLEIETTIEVNNNKILRGAFLQEGFEEKDLSSLILSVDKLKKIGEEGVITEIKEKGFDEKKSKRAISTLSSKSFEEIKDNAQNELLKEGIDELEKLVSLLKLQKVDFRVNFSMSRGLNYYTGNIWEAYEKNKKITSSIGSGGRYDKGIGNYLGDDREYPAVGISFGIIPILECIEKEAVEGVSEILVVPLDKQVVGDALRIAKKLREKNSVELYYEYKLKKAFSYAEYLGIKRIAIIGKKDIENKVFTLKDIQSGDEEKINLD